MSEEQQHGGPQRSSGLDTRRRAMPIVAAAPLDAVEV